MPKLYHLDNPIQFYTATILEWKHLLKPDKYKQIIVNSLTFLVNEQRVKVFGFVIMSNHIHLIWQGTKMNSLKHMQLSFKNPVKANLCEKEIEYKYSSAKHYMNIEHEFAFLEPYNEAI